MIVLLFLLCMALCQAAIEGNGGTQVGISGVGYSILASDRKLIDSYSIKSKEVTRLYKVDDGLVLSTNGMHADGLALSSVLRSAVAKYEFENGKKIQVEPLSYLLSSVLYSRRFNPYSSNCALAGIDNRRQGALYRYDSVGSFERVPAFAIGNGGQYIQPSLDEVVERYGAVTTETSERLSSPVNVLTLPVSEACDKIISMYKAAGSREITIGREIELCIIESVSDSVKKVTLGGKTSSVAGTDSVVKHSLIKL